MFYDIFMEKYCKFKTITSLKEKSCFPPTLFRLVSLKNVPESLFRRKSDRQLEMMIRSKVFIVSKSAKLIFAAWVLQTLDRLM